MIESGYKTCVEKEIGLHAHSLLTILNTIIAGTIYNHSTTQRILTLTMNENIHMGSKTHEGNVAAVTIWTH